MAADQALVEGKLLSDKYAELPGSIVWWNNQYKLGKKQSGASPLDTTYALQNLPVVKACSHYAGGALFLTYNAEGMNNSHLQFWASPTLEGLQGKGGNCPPVPTTPAPQNVSVCYMYMHI